MDPNKVLGLPELMPEVMLAMSKYFVMIKQSRIFLAEIEALNVEIGVQDKAPGFSGAKLAGFYKDVALQFTEANNLFEEAFKKMTPDAKKHFQVYYLNYCQGMKCFYESVYWFYYGISFPENQRENMLGCYNQYKQSCELLGSKFIDKLPKHKEFIVGKLKGIQEQVEKAFGENSKIYFSVPNESVKIPILKNESLIPNVDFTPEGYLAMLSSAP